MEKTNKTEESSRETWIKHKKKYIKTKIITTTTPSINTMCSKSFLRKLKPPIEKIWNTQIWKNIRNLISFPVNIHNLEINLRNKIHIVGPTSPMMPRNIQRMEENLLTKELESYSNQIENQEKFFLNSIHGCLKLRIKRSTKYPKKC